MPATPFGRLGCIQWIVRNAQSFTLSNWNVCEPLSGVPKYYKTQLRSRRLCDILPMFFHMGLESFKTVEGTRGIPSQCDVQFIFCTRTATCACRASRSMDSRCCSKPPCCTQTRMKRKAGRLPQFGQLSDPRLPKAKQAWSTERCTSCSSLRFPAWTQTPTPTIRPQGNRYGRHGGQSKLDGADAGVYCSSQGLMDIWVPTLKW